MLLGWRKPYLRRSGTEERSSAGRLELFYDLVFVAAFVQLGEALGDDVSWGGARRAGAVFALLWWSWTATTFAVNWVAGDDPPQRFLVLAQAFAIACAAALAGDAFGTHAVAFAHAGVRLALVGLLVRAHLRVPKAKGISRLYGSAFGIGALAWLASALLPDALRPWARALAVAVEIGVTLTRPALRLLDATPPDEEHLSERFALLTLVVLRESFVKVVDGLSDDGLSPSTLLLAALAFAIAATWVHLRACGDCGHHDAERHPVVWSLEPDEDWARCYEDARATPQAPARR